MARTVPMRLLELMILKNDVDTVLEFLGKHGNFQFQEGTAPYTSANIEKNQQQNPDGDLFNALQSARIYLNSEDFSEDDLQAAHLPSEDDRNVAKKLIADVDALKNRELTQTAATKRISEALAEAKAFANLKVALSNKC